MIANVNNFRESKRRSTFVLQNRIDGNLLNHHRNSNNESSKMPNQSINSSKLELLDKRRLSNNFFSLGTLKKFKMRNSIKDGSPLKSLFKKMETLKDGAFYQFFISTRNSLIGIDIVLFFLIVLNIFLSFVSLEEEVSEDYHEEVNAAQILRAICVGISILTCLFSLKFRYFVNFEKILSQ